MFDTIKALQEIKNYSDLSKIYLVRRAFKAISSKMSKTKLNFLELFSNADQSQNIIIFHGVRIKVNKLVTFLKINT